MRSEAGVIFYDKQEATLFEFWERDLRPMVHFVPVKADFSDLVEMVEWALDNDDLVRWGKGAREGGREGGREVFFWGGGEGERDTHTHRNRESGRGREGGGRQGERESR